MARVLTYISFIVFLLVLCMAAQAGTGPTPENEGKEVFPLLSICIFLYISSSLQFILNIHSAHCKMKLALRLPTYIRVILLIFYTLF